MTAELSIHPIEYRYGSDDVKRVFSKDNWLKLFIEVEIAILESLEKNKVIPKGISDEVKKSVKSINIKDVDKWERVIKHEAMAVVLAMHEKAGDAGRYIHLGATSNDILDTILGLQIREAGNIILHRLHELIRELILLAWKERATPCLGRTHGRAAIPITFGYKLLLFIDELDRSRELLANAIDLSTVGKYAGAVGTHVELGGIGELVEKQVMEKLDLKVARHATQIIPRDIYAYLFTSISILSSILDQLGREIRNLQRSGIEEVLEPFTEKQVGSSVMPHKRNPILSEKICGLAKVIRSLSLGWMENIVVEHERDLTNSSFERMAVPEAFILLDEQLLVARRIVAGLEVNRDKMLQNIEQEGLWIYSDILIQTVALKGGDRQVAHEHIRKIIMSGGNIEDILNDEYLATYITKADLNTETLLRRCIKAASEKTVDFLTKISKKYGVSLSN